MKTPHCSSYQRLKRNPIVEPALFFWFVAAVLLALPIPVESHDSSRSCIAEDTKIYSGGEPGIKGAKLLEPVPLERPPRIKSRVVFEVLVNSAGRICDVHIITAPDRDTAFRVGRYVGENLHFTPARFEGKPVAARLKLVLDEHGRVSTEK